MSPKTFQNDFKLISHKYETRGSKQNFCRSKSSSKLTAFRILDRGTRIWNSLDTNAKNITSIFQFKKVAKKEILKYSNCELNNYF